MLKSLRRRPFFSDGSAVLRKLTLRYASQSHLRTSFQGLDAKWQARWAEASKELQDGSMQKSYVLPMFAYPSGTLHMGHLRVYTISDVIARHRRMKGHRVLHPTGWDAFGLPAENAAIERGIDPGDWTLTNIKRMKEQLKSMNTHFDWDAEISTCSPDFYKHTQKLFLMLYEKNLAYQAEAIVNWDPVDKTVLANEQVDSHGRSWRSGAVVEQKMLRQWFFRITEFQEDLLHDLDVLAENNDWPERVLTQQRNWIGQSTGARITFDIVLAENTSQPVNVFTTRPDTLFGVKYLALSLSHPIVLKMAASLPQLQTFIDQRTTFAPDSKAGFRLPLEAISPATISGSTTVPKIPVYAAPYVLDDYGEGAVMGVPGHDSRDLAFWKQHAPNDTVPMVVAGEGAQQELEPLVSTLEEAYSSQGILTKLCGKYAGMNSQEGSQHIVTDLARLGKAELTQTWRLRDWLISRQRYWGTPIPINHCNVCGPVAVPENDLPVVLPKLDSSVKGQTGNPLDKCVDWVKTSCPSCGGAAKRETDTMDTFVDSSWYYMRFPDSKNEKELFSTVSAAATLPVDTYVGGVEHAILHLLYARFIYKFLCKEGLIRTKHKIAEPFMQLVAQGMVHGKTYSDPDTGRFLVPAELDHSNSEPVIKATGKAPKVSYEKMSKSKYNGVDPSECMTKYGADATRAHILFAAPVSEVLRWDEEKIIGIQRWFQRVTRIVADVCDLRDSITARDLTKITDTDADVLLMTQSTIASVTDTLETNVYALNTYISDLIKLTNSISDANTKDLSPVIKMECVVNLVQMLTPVAPAFAEECWETLREAIGDGHLGVQGHTTSVFESRWPEKILTPEEETQLKQRRKTQTCAVQINGKLRFTAEVPLPPESIGKVKSKEHEQAVIDTVLSTAQGDEWLKVKNNWDTRKRVIVVNGGRVLNIVF